jgi:hypothetical protein
MNTKCSPYVSTVTAKTAKHRKATNLSFVYALFSSNTTNLSFARKTHGDSGK